MQITSLRKRIVLIVATTLSGGAIQVATEASINNINSFSYFSASFAPQDSKDNKNSDKLVTQAIGPKINHLDIVQEVASEQLWQTSRNSESIQQEAERIRRTLNDYTFKLFTPCGYGTGWILDYQLAEGGKYPTIWYVATNAHVIEKLRFPDNPYSQVLPKDAKEVARMRRKNNYFQVKKKHKNIRLDSEGEHCNSSDKYGYSDINISWGKMAEHRKGDYGAVGLGQMEEPKLFFSAFDFLDHKTAGVDKHHYTDFAVLELKFTSEKSAKAITGNFAIKYPLNAGRNPINIFERPLEARYDRETLNNLDENFYIVAYPENKSNKWKGTFNFDPQSNIASRLGNGSNTDKKGRYKRGVRGLVRAAEIAKKIENFWWGGKMFKEFGHIYEMEHHPLGQGSSGALLVDRNVGVIGITGLTTVGKGASTSWFVPLRSEGVDIEESGIATPKFDLILGVEGQLNSYRQQVEKYITSQGKKTWLSARGWRHRVVTNYEKWFSDDAILNF